MPFVGEYGSLIMMCQSHCHFQFSPRHAHFRISGRLTGAEPNRCVAVGCFSSLTRPQCNAATSSSLHLAKELCAALSCSKPGMKPAHQGPRSHPKKARVKSVACRRIKRSHRNFVAKPCSEACLACPSSSSGSRQMRNLPVPSKSVQASQCRGACTHQPNSPIAVTRAHPRPAPSAGTPRPHSGGTPPAGRPLPPRSTPETPGVVKADVTLPVLWPSAPAGAGQRA